jgi:exopolysaccharide production protein ExoQ
VTAAHYPTYAPALPRRRLVADQHVTAVWEYVVAIAIVFLLSGAFIGPVFARDATGETPLLRLVWLPVYAAIIGLVLVRFEVMLRMWFPLVVALALAGLAFASSWWSIAPDVTERRVIALVFTSVFATWAAGAFPGRQLPLMLTWAGLIMGVGALGFVVAWPEVGIHQDANAGLWRGLWSEKNQMGWVMVATATAAAAVLASPGRGKVLAVATWLLSTGLVLGTHSKTALLCLIASSGVIAGLWMLKKLPPALSVAAVWLGVIVAAVAATVILTAPEVVLEALGKDPSLTGRTDIWAALGRRVEERPLWGYGYSAFWGAHSVPALYIREETQWLVPSAHNGWLEILVELGWVGTVAIAIVVGLAVLGVVAHLFGRARHEGFWSAGYLAAFIILSLSESVLLRHQSLPWVLFLIAFARAFAPAAGWAPEPVDSRPLLAHQARRA